MGGHAQFLGQFGLQGLALVGEIEQVPAGTRPTGFFERTPDGGTGAGEPRAQTRSGGLQRQRGNGGIHELILSTAKPVMKRWSRD
jgi:hypothetical protein